MDETTSSKTANTTTLSTAIFGAADGLVATMALILATMGHGHKVVLLAVFGLLVAEGLGMAASEFLSDPQRDLKTATIMGAATSVAIVLPGIPWTFTSGETATLTSCAVGLILAGVIAAARRGGWATWVQTYGILVVVGAIATLAGHLS
jgi:VIT family